MILTTAEWVHRLNVLGQQMDAAVATMHPSAWHAELAGRGFFERWEKILHAEISDAEDDQFQMLLFTDD